MASDAHARFSSFVLQQSDQQPIRTISGEDLAMFDSAVVREFERDGLIVPLRDLRDADGMVFSAAGNHAVLASAADGDVARVSPLALQRWRIEFDAIARLLRTRLELVGPPVEALGGRISFLGASGAGRRRRQVYLARCLRTDRALEPLLNVRAHAGEATAVVVLALREQDLSRSVKRQIGDMKILALLDLINTSEPVPFCVRLPLGPSSELLEPETARLVIDAGGNVAMLDGREFSVQARDFATLTLLATEASIDAGYVPREALSAAMRGATHGEGYDEQVSGSITRLRAALRRIDPAVGISNKRGVGYRLELPQNQIDVR